MSNGNISEPKKIVQGEFREIMLMGRNNMAMPKNLGIAIELSLLQTKLINANRHKIHLKQSEIDELIARQVQLMKERERI